MSGAISASRLMALWKQGWNEIPEVMASFCLSSVGIAMGVYGVHQYNKKDGDNKLYKATIIVLRPDDPRVAKIRKD